MKKYWTILIAGFFIVVLTNSCLDPFSLPATESSSEYLVIDGFLNSDEGSCTVSLTRTVPLNSDEQVQRETNAGVYVESETGESFVLSEIFTGTYSASGLPIDNAKKYRLRVQTLGGLSFVSELVEIRSTPPIDSVSWKLNGNKVSIYANTHDDNDATRYYLWQYSETWAYHSAYQSSVKFVDGDVIPREPEEFNYNCWQSRQSSKILTASSAKLERDIISEFELLALQTNDEKLQTRYSILVSQYAITKAAYEYWEELKKNTENLGTLFDPQPSQLTGNFICTNKPDEPVIGYFQAGSMQVKRLFIRKGELPPVRTITQYDACTYDTILLQHIPNFKGNGLLINGVGVTLIGYTRSSTFCVDCRLAGGTLTKPDFW